jgi:hypothetical protein
MASAWVTSFAAAHLRSKFNHRTMGGENRFPLKMNEKSRSQLENKTKIGEA